MTIRLEELGACFQGVIPSVIATCGRDGEPNVTFLSQVYYAGPGRVALSCQFFNKTKRNVAENPYATVNLWDPRNFDIYRLELTLHHIETEGPLFDTMAARIQVIASHSGMKGIFRLLSADVYEVQAIEKIQELNAARTEPPAGSADFLPPGMPALEVRQLSELQRLQSISGRVARARDLDSLLAGVLEAIHEVFDFGHSMVFVPDSRDERLVAIASRGYGAEGVGAEVAFGAGVFGVAASERRLVRVAAMGEELRYGRAIRKRFADRGRVRELMPEVPLPGLQDARSQLGLPLLVGDRLVGVLGLESRDPVAFDEWDEAFLQIVADQIAMGIDRMDDDGDSGDTAGQEPVPEGPAKCARKLKFTYFRNDEVVFVDDEYLVRNVPAKIFWKILGQRSRDGRTEFTNRELRLDDSLGLPGYKDNLESRLILLRKRLVEKCPQVRMVPVRRGRFALQVEGEVEMVEKDSA